MCNSFCYLGDTLDGDGGADLAAIAKMDGCSSGSFCHF